MRLKIKSSKDESPDNPFWIETAKKVLLNKKIVSVRYMTTQEADDLGWHSRPVVFTLDDGTMCCPSADDEGNNGGALFYGGDGVLPVL